MKYQPYKDFSTHTVVSSGSELATTKKRLTGVTTQGKDERLWKNRTMQNGNLQGIYEAWQIKESPKTLSWELEGTNTAGRHFVSL